MFSKRSILVILFLGVHTMFAENFFKWKNSDFESGFQKWSGKHDFCQITQQAAHSGHSGLRIHDNSDKYGSDLLSQDFPVTPGVTYALHFWGRSIKHGENLALYHKYYDKDGKYLPLKGEIFLYLGNSPDWRQYTLTSRAPQDASTMKIWIHSMDKLKTTADIDDLKLAALTKEEERDITTTTTRATKNCFPALDYRRVQTIATMLPSHPRGIGIPASDRKSWETFHGTDLYKQIIARAEQSMDAQIPDTSDELYMEFLNNGNRSHYEDVYFRKRDMLCNLTLGECMEYQGRFLPKLELVLKSILDEKSWVLPAHDSELLNFNNTICYADLFCSETIAELSEMDWLLQDKLPHELRLAIRQQAYHRAYKYYQNVIRNGFIPYGSAWMIWTNNWNAVCTRNLVAGALSLIENPMQRAEILAAAEISSRFFASGFTADGYCSEGVNYWGYGFGFFMDMNELVLMATNGKLDLLAQNPSLNAVCEYPKNILMENGLTPLYADCGPGTPALNTQELIQWHHPELLLQRVKHTIPTRKLVVFSIHAFGKPTADITRAAETPILGERNYFRNAGVLICRKLDATSNFTAAIKAGHNAEMHNHNDVGSYVIAVKGIQLVLDPGGENYTRRTFSAERYVSNVLNSYGHAVPVIAGKLQATGAKHKGVIIAEKFTSEADDILIDMTSAYECPELVRLIRHFRFDRQNAMATVTDEVLLSSPQTFQDAIITNSAYEIASPKALTIKEKESSLQVMINVQDAGNWNLTTEKIQNPNQIEPTRIAITPEKPLLHAIVTMQYKMN